VGDLPKNHAAGVTGLIMDADTGAIVAMASYPVLRPTNSRTTDASSVSNPAIARQYEPGS
jgi:cell division protein FtsI/penicillin-binding protein 2